MISDDEDDKIAQLIDFSQDLFEKKCRFKPLEAKYNSKKRNLLISIEGKRNNKEKESIIGLKEELDAFYN